MKSTALQPTFENIKSSLINDSIGRNEDLRYFLKLLDSLEGCYSLALDGGWGSGKTFFVRQAKLALDCLNGNSHVKIDPETRIQIEEIALKKKKGDKYEIKQTYSTVYYDAWMNDSHDDPIITLLYAFATQLGIQGSVGKSRNYIDIIIKIIDAVKGMDLTSIKEAFKSENLFESLVTEQGIQEMFSQLINELIEEHGDRLVVFIDELDRCSPTFAVKLLERVKHYLFDDRIIFVFAVNLSELKHTVNNFYGTGFSGDKYLDRFFDMVVRLPEPSFPKFFESIEFEESDNLFSQICHLTIKSFRLELREITRFVDAMKHYNYDYTLTITSSMPLYSKAVTDYFCIVFLLPVLVGLNLNNSNKFDEFVSGENPQPLLDIYKDSIQGIQLANLLGETLVLERSNAISRNVENKIRELYEAVFIRQYSISNPELHLGKFVFDEDTKNQLLRNFGKLSPYANY